MPEYQDLDLAIKTMSRKNAQMESLHNDYMDSKQDVIDLMVGYELAEYETSFGKAWLETKPPTIGPGHDIDQVETEYPDINTRQLGCYRCDVPLRWEPYPGQIIQSRLNDLNLDPADLARVKELLDYREPESRWRVGPKKPVPLPPGWPDDD